MAAKSRTSSQVFVSLRQSHSRSFQRAKSIEISHYCLFCLQGLLGAYRQRTHCTYKKMDDGNFLTAIHHLEALELGWWMLAHRGLESPPLALRLHVAAAVKLGDYCSKFCTTLAHPIAKAQKISNWKSLGRNWIGKKWSLSVFVSAARLNST